MINIFTKKETLSDGTRIIYGRPPAKVLEWAGKVVGPHIQPQDLFDAGIVFSYDGAIYARDPMPQSLIEHEKMHLFVQKQIGADNWWKQFAEDKDFRLGQELLGYRRQYDYLKSLNLDSYDLGQEVKYMAKVLSGPIYGNMITFKTAKELITKII